MATSGKHWVTEPTQEIQIQMEKSGFGSVAPRTVMQSFHEALRKSANKPALLLKRPVNVS